MAKKPVKEIMIRFYDKEEDKETLTKVSKLKNLFNEKSENKTIKKIIREFKIN